MHMLYVHCEQHDADNGLELPLGGDEEKHEGGEHDEEDDHRDGELAGHHSGSLPPAPVAEHVVPGRPMRMLDAASNLHLHGSSKLL